MRDWAVICTNGLTCTLSFSKDAAEGLTTVGLERENAPNAPVKLVVSAPAGIAQTDDVSGTFSVSVDGVDLLNVPVADMSKHGYLLAYSNPGKIDALRAAMERGMKMTVRYAGAGGEESLTTSLSGVKAGLLFIDDVQDRVKRVDALVAKGDRPMPARASVRDLEAFSDLPAAIRPDFEGDKGDCGGIAADRFAEAGAFEAQLDDGAVLLGLPCGLPGAYNQPYVFYAEMGGKVRQLALPVIGDDGPTVETMAFNVSYDVGRRQVEAFYKGRGLGDCGSYDVWNLKAGPMGPVFVLKEERQKGDCDGDYAGGPKHWPRLWPPA
jgi:hypothetical protein